MLKRAILASPSRSVCQRACAFSSPAAQMANDMQPISAQKPKVSFSYEN